MTSVIKFITKSIVCRSMQLLFTLNITLVTTENKVIKHRMMVISIYIVCSNLNVTNVNSVIKILKNSIIFRSI